MVKVSADIGSAEPGDDGYFWVEVCRDAAGQLKAVAPRYFKALEAASAYATSMGDGLYAWIGEHGHYRKRSGNVAEAWFYFWWSDNTDYGPCEHRGLGWRSDAAFAFVEYFPSHPAYVPPPNRAQSIRQLEA